MEENKLKDTNFFKAKSKLFLAISLGIIALGLVMSLIYTAVFGSPFNYGTDFAGGYNVTVQFSAKIDNVEFGDTIKDLKSIIESTKLSASDNDDNQGIKADGATVSVERTMQFGASDTPGVKFVYKAIGNDAYMDKLGQKIVDNINDKYAKDDKYHINAVASGYNKPQVTLEVLANSLIVLMLALVLIFLFVALRFNFVSALASIITVLHNLAVLVALFAITRFRLNYEFLIAVLATVSISIINLLLVLERIKEKTKHAIADKNVELIPEQLKKNGLGDSLPALSIVNLSIFGIMALITIASAIFAPSVALFMLPLVIAIAISVHGSLFLAPTIFASITTRHNDLLHKRTVWRGIGSFLNKIFAKKEKNTTKKVKKTKKNKETIGT